MMRTFEQKNRERNARSLFSYYRFLIINVFFVALAAARQATSLQRLVRSV